MATDPDKWKTIQLAMRGGWGSTARYIAIRTIPATVVTAAGLVAIAVRVLLGS